MSSTIRGDDNFDSADGGDLDPRLATVWVEFDGTGAVAIRDQFNVTSITDLGTGDYQINYTAALADTDYSALATQGTGNGIGYAAITQTANTTAKCNLRTRDFVANGTNVAADLVSVQLVIFGGQA